MSRVLIEAKGLGFHPAHKPNPLYADLDVCLTDATHFMVGDNGCGKSTLAKNLSQQSSQVTHYGIVGYLNQELNPFSGTVAEKLNIAPILQALQRCEEGTLSEKDFDLLENNWDIKAVLEKQLDSYGLPNTIITEPYISLSGGMRTRLNLLHLERQQCDFYILDEPSNHLDRASRDWLSQWIKLPFTIYGGKLINFFFISLRGQLASSHWPKKSVLKATVEISALRSSLYFFQCNCSLCGNCPKYRMYIGGNNLNLRGYFLKYKWSSIYLCKQIMS